MYGRKVEELSGKVLKFWLLLFVTPSKGNLLYLEYFKESTGEMLPKKIDAVRKGLLTCIFAIDNRSIAVDKSAGHGLNPFETGHGQRLNNQSYC